MRLRAMALSLPLVLLLACTSTPPWEQPAVPSSRTYNGTASVGDFMTITIDSIAKTISYSDVSNSTRGTAPYVVNADGTYSLNDPTGNLIAAYEVPGYAMLIQAAKTGPNADAPALITAVESGPISLSTFTGKSYNYMQFRTAAGGIEAGSVTVNAQGMGTNSSYWPYGALNGGNPGQSTFNSGTIDLTQAQLDSSGTFLQVSEAGNGGGTDYIFGTANGVFAVDTANGAILGLPKAASKDFDPSMAGAYQAIYYQKTGASTGQNNAESGSPTLGTATILVTQSGDVTVSNELGNVMAQGTLQAVEDTPYLYGSTGELNDPCHGLFTFRVQANGMQQDVFVSFVNQSMLFASFSAASPWTPGGTYNYVYGVGLKS